MRFYFLARRIFAPRLRIIKLLGTTLLNSYVTRRLLEVYIHAADMHAFREVRAGS